MNTRDMRFTRDQSLDGGAGGKIAPDDTAFRTATRPDIPDDAERGIATGDDEVLPEPGQRNERLDTGGSLLP